MVGTYDGASSRLYVNGLQVATTALTGAIGSTSNGFNIASWDGYSERLKGTIDEVAVYPSALPASQVRAHYDTGTGPPPPPVA